MTERVFTDYRFPFFPNGAWIMNEVNIAFVPGDGAAPEMMDVAANIAEAAAQMDNIQLKFINAPMGWNAFKEHGDTLPASSMQTVRDSGIVFFGGVGEKRLDATLGV